MIDLDAFVSSSFSALKALKKLIDETSDYATLCVEQSVGFGGDKSITIDLEAEKILVSHLQPFGQIISEESGHIGEGEYTIVLDPIDGSDNFKSHFAYYASSIALKHQDRTLVGIVANLATGDTYVRVGEELYIENLLNGRKKAITVNTYAKVGLFEKALFHVDKIEILRQKGLKFRSPGAVALSIASAHYVKYVLFLGTIRPYDVAAALFITEGLYSHVDKDTIIVSYAKDTFDELCKIFIK